MKKTLGFILAGVLCLYSCCKQHKPVESAPQKDSIAKVVTDCLLQENYERATEVVDSADAAGWLSPFDAEMLRLRILGRNEANLLEAQARYTALLDGGKLTPTQELEVLSMLMNVIRLRRDDEKALKYGARLVDVSRQLGHETQALTTQAELGSVMIRIGRTEEGLALIEGALEQLDLVRQFRELDACVLVMKSKIRTLIDLKRYEEVIPVGERIITKLNDFAAHPEVYADKSPRLPSDERRPGYVDFYTGQAYAFMTYAYASLSRFDEARTYSRLFDGTHYSRSYGGRKHMASSWCILGEYDRMYEVYEQMKASMGADTVNYDYGVMLFNYAQAAQAKGRYAQSAEYWRRYNALQKKLNEAERMAAAEESAARYHEQEHQYALEKEQALRKRDSLIAIALSIVSLLLAAVAFLIFYQLYTTRRKNAVLSKEIAESLDYKTRYLSMKSHPELTVEQKDKESTPKLSAMSDAELFDFLCVVIVGEQLYLNPYFERQNLVDRFGLSKDRIGAAFSQGSSYNSLSNYINECRLGHSAHLLSTRPDMSISDVAVASGFTNASVFTRNFKQRYTLTPSEYRKEKQ